MLIVGSDYTDVASPSELSVNARIAVNLGAPVVLAVRAADRTPEDVAHVVELCLAELAGQHAHTAAVVANRCDPAELDAVAAALQARRARGPAVLRAAGGAAAGRPVGRRAAGLRCDGKVISGDEDLLHPRGARRAGRQA